MSYCKEKNKRLWREMQEDWIEEIIGVNLGQDFIKYDFKDNDEWSVRDYEQSPLCQIIWGEIISEFFTNKNKQEYTYLINRYYLIVKNDKESHRFLFDVMNNGKSCYNKNGDCYRYHFIGNFTPIPANNMKRKRSLQLIHKDFNEDWNETLKYIQHNWNEFGMNFSFDDYVEMTIQNDYYPNKSFKDISSIKQINNLINARGLEIQKKCKKFFKSDNK